MIELVKEVPFEIMLEEAKLTVDAYEYLVKGLEILETLSIGKLDYGAMKEALDAHVEILDERRKALADLYAEADELLVSKTKDD